MVELAVTNFKSIKDFKQVEKMAIGFKPCFIFQGPEFENREEYKKVANLILDFFRGRQVDSINLVGLDHVIVCTVVNDIICFRNYVARLVNSGSHVPNVELREMGPSFDMEIRRTQFAPDDLVKEAIRVPESQKVKKPKNTSTNVFGEKVGRVYKKRQDLSHLELRKMKGTKKRGSKEVTEGKPEEKSEGKPEGKAGGKAKKIRKNED